MSIFSFKGRDGQITTTVQQIAGPRSVLRIHTAKDGEPIQQRDIEIDDAGRIIAHGPMPAVLEEAAGV